MFSLKAPRFDNILFLQGLSERVRHFKLKCVAGLCSKLVFRNSGHIQQFRVEAISLGAGRVSLCGLDSLHFHLSTYLFAYQGIPDPASCRAGLRRGGSVPEPTSPCTPLPQGSRLGDFAQPRKSARLVVPRVADREDVRKSGTMDGTSRQRRCPVCVVRTGACSTAERRSTRLVPHPVADGRRR